MSERPTAAAELDPRKAEILAAIVRLHVVSGEPVGSRAVADVGQIGVSSATVRNEMALLEDSALIEQPHTSAGRVPTQAGYRYFVDHLVDGGRVSDTQREAVSYFFASHHDSLVALLHETSQLLAQLTDHAGVVVGPNVDTVDVRSIRLTPLDHELVAVAVLSDGSVVREAIALETMPGDGVVARAEAALDTAFVGHPLGASGLIEPGPHDEDSALVAAVAEAFARHRDPAPETCFVGGTARIADPDDFGADGLAELLDLLEHPEEVARQLRPTPRAGVTVHIGAENELVELRGCALVAAPFATGPQSSGSVAVLGPTRMDYVRAMGVVVHVSDRLGRALSDLGA